MPTQDSNHPVPAGDDAAEYDAMPETGDPVGALLAPLGAFLRQFGFTTLVAVMFIVFVYQDRQDGAQATALQMKDLNGQLLQMSGLLAQHHADSEQQARRVTDILLATCLNQANGVEDKVERCIGRR